MIIILHTLHDDNGKEVIPLTEVVGLVVFQKKGTNV